MKKTNLGKRSAKIQRNTSFSSQTSSSLAQTSLLSNYGPLDNFITRPLSKVIELFKFLNLLVKLSDRKTLSDKILHEAVTDLNNTIIEKLKSDRIGITLSFDAMDVSGERHKTDDVITKTEEMIIDIRELLLIVYQHIMLQGDTRWNSYLTCCSSIKVTKNILWSLATKFEPSQLNTRHQSNDPLTISQDIYSIIMNENF
ncbi:1393_t:CDS:2 [Diversispora eburnea]|uniref:1393_t:CDS:1 n=1 Tax=Diversispora eburnea TaxID=1213867 RepID=A0A9N9D1R6_9GLOM|nr:1393_t:CDS:2 [Diversispora eburnea]